MRVAAGEGVPVAGKPESVGVAGSVGDGLVGMRPSLRVLADRPLEDDRDDCLGYGAFADALAELIDHPETDTPLTIALSAPWGAGKTTLARLVERRLVTWPAQRGEPPHITCWFNAWMHDDAPHLGSAFAAEVSKQADRHRMTFRRLVNPLSSAMLSSDRRTRRRLYLAVMGFVAGLVVAFVLQKFVLFDEGLVQRVQDAYGATVTVLFLVFSALFTAWTKVFSVAQAVAGFVKDPKKEAATGSMREVSDQLGGLLQEVMGGKRRFVIFVDDLERCRPPRAVEVCEVAKQLLSHPGVVTVLVADMASIAACADVKYAPLEGRYPVIDTRAAGRGSLGETYGQIYLEKIVQIQFDLPIPSVRAMRRLVNSSSTHEAPHELEGGSPEKVQAPTLATPARRERVPEVLELVGKQGWKIALGLILGLGQWVGTYYPVDPAPLGMDIVLGLLTTVVLPVFALIRIGMAVRRLVRRRAARRNRVAVDKQIKQSAGSDDSRVEQLAAKVQQLQSGQVNPGLVAQRVQRYLIDESQLRQQADAEVLPFLPPLPRAAKRMLNLLRLLLTVAVRRGMLGGQPEMTAQHLAKWAVLISRWPELGSALRAAPEEMANLEGAVDISELADRLQGLNYHRPVTQDLLLVLKSSTELAPVMARLVACEPVTADGHASTMTASHA